MTWEILELISTNRLFFIRLILTFQVEHIAPFLYERLQRKFKAFDYRIRPWVFYKRKKTQTKTVLMEVESS